jgi:hypothetical protein
MRPTHTISTVLAGAALAAGCGAAEPASKPAARQAAPAYSAPQVASFFRDVTGDPLAIDNSIAFDALTPDRGDYERSGRMDERYGRFQIYILHEPGADSIYKRQNRQPVRPDARGVYWHGEGGGWTAMKPYRNVVLSWSGEEQALDERFERLDFVLSRLGRPAEQVRAALPPEDQPCGERPTGTCRDENGATVTTVERGERLTLPDLQVKVYKVQTGRFVVPPRRYGLIRRAKGRFVLAAMRLKNTGNESLRGLYDVKLKIGDRLYDQHSTATWTVTPLEAFPVQPGDSAVAALVFDVPVSAAREALAEGMLVFPAGDDLATVEDAAHLGQIRLARPGAVSTAEGSSKA